jgi:phosphatidylglycerophosphate synthase
MTQPARGRVNNSILQPLERPTLAWLAARMPPWINSDRLTCLGIFGSFLTFVSYGLTTTHRGFFFLASFGIFLNWIGDSLDGTLARYRKRERPRYGFFVDHTVDTFNEMFIILGLGLTAFIRFEVACLALIAYLMISVYAFVRTAVTNTLQITIGYIGGTEMRVMLIGFFIALIALAASIIAESRKLAAEDPPKSG